MTSGAARGDARARAAGSLLRLPPRPAPDAISIRGAREHNLRDVDLDIPRGKLVVVTGLSGSGKSSLAFDTLYAEGQRRYVESLSAYARQFLDQMSKPDVDAIDGLSPAIAIEQKTASRSPRSTVGTVTEILDYLRVLYARAGEPHCWECGNPISSQTPAQMAERVLRLPEGTRAWVLAPVVRGRKGSYKKELEQLRKQGFVRARIDGAMRDLDDDVAIERTKRHDIDVVVDRIAVKASVGARLRDSIEQALRLGDGLVRIAIGDAGAAAGGHGHGDARAASAGAGAQEWTLSASSSCADCGTSFPEIAPRLFSFNAPSGACPDCNGLGVRHVLDPARIVPDPTLPLARAIAPWRAGRGRVGLYYERLLEGLAAHFGVELATPWGELPARVRDGILFGTGDAAIELALETRKRARKRSVARTWEGVVDELERREATAREDGAIDGAEERELERYRSPVACEACEGARLRPEARSVTLLGRGIHDVARLPIASLPAFVDELEASLTGTRAAVAQRVLGEIRDRARFLCDVGLAYLTLDRPAATLSGGEAQRIRLATQIGSRLMGVLYILDEPSIGLHARDCGRLLASLEQLRDIGNSVVVVEHDEETIRRADWVVDMGPGAGVHGGHVVACGTPAEIEADAASPTGAYLAGRERIAAPRTRRAGSGRALVLGGCREHNLKDVTLRIPLGTLTVVTGVSGSGKSSLVRDTLHRALAARLHGARETPGAFATLAGLEHVDKVTSVDQSPIGRTPRSNPATYVGAFDGIRRVFSQVPEARVRGFGPGRFSFNVKGGRCEACQGDGLLRIEMHFLPDSFVTCQTCGGRRYDRETLAVKYKGASIADVLEMTVEEAATLFENAGAVARPLRMLEEVGLGYLALGQPATTLSGGEAQRIKLARELGKRSTGRTLYLLDEPTTGLHFADVAKLLELLQRLVELGNTVVVVEHHVDVILAADHVVDLGPEGGEDGGEIVVEGTPEDVARCARSHTGRALAERLRRAAR
ncbi:MAG: excinuclease ABC subunit UvrA [Myxococcota bacterium]